MTTCLYDKKLYSKSVSAAETTASSYISFLTEENLMPVPCGYSRDPIISSSYSWEKNVLSPKYSLDKIEDENIEQAKIVHEFASKVLINSKELDPEIRKIMDENIWELL